MSATLVETPQATQVDQSQAVAQVTKQKRVKKPRPPKTSDVKKTRRVVTTDSVNQAFQLLTDMIETHIKVIQERTQSGKGAPMGVKFLKSLRKNVRSLHHDVQKVSSTHPRRKRPTNAKSGFQKPVRVTQEMSDFAGWNSEEMKSRVDVTKAICSYVKTQNLQNPSNRRLILPDSRLSTLLRYDVNNPSNSPLTYFELQKRLKHLFVPKEQQPQQVQVPQQVS